MESRPAKILFDRLGPATARVSDDAEENASVAAYLEEARGVARGDTRYRAWGREYLGLPLPGILGVFLFQGCRAADREWAWVWVVVGDLPPLLIEAVEGLGTAEAALLGYVERMEAWVRTVRGQGEAETLSLVDVPPREEYAAMLESRCGFIRLAILARS